MVVGAKIHPYCSSEIVLSSPAWLDPFSEDDILFIATPLNVFEVECVVFTCSVSRHRKRTNKNNITADNRTHRAVRAGQLRI